MPSCIRAAILMIALLGAGFAQQQFDYDRNAPLDVKEVKVEMRDGVRIREVTYASPKGGRVPAYIVEPKSGGPFAAVIYGHWCMPGSEQKNRTEFLPEAIALARSGVVSVLPDHVTVRPGFVEDPTPLNTQQIEAQAQQVVDMRRAADLLLARKDVDPKRLAYVGHSCDGTVGGILSGVDKRFKAFVIMAGSLSDQIDIQSPAYQKYREKVGAEKFDAFVQKYAWTDPGRYVAHAAPAAMFLQYATQEPYLTPDRAKRYFELVSEPKKMKIYDAPHALNAEATRDRIAFLADQLGFKPPAAKAVAAIPELAQPPWPKR
jgi:dienelactone hydrolase